MWYIDEDVVGRYDRIVVYPDIAYVLEVQIETNGLTNGIDTIVTFRGTNHMADAKKKNFDWFYKSYFFIPEGK